jgi:hypothetical protein
MISYPILSFVIGIGLAIVAGLLSIESDNPEIAKRMSIKRLLRKIDLLPSAF